MQFVYQSLLGGYIKAYLTPTLICYILVGTGIVGQSRAAETYYPDWGDLWTIANFADSYIQWRDPGDWSVSEPGYEHDFVFNKGYFTGCITWTDLPDGYDDCPTAGVAEQGNEIVFSFGSFNAKSIQPSEWYWGAWSFEYHPNAGYGISAFLRGQESYKRIPFPCYGIWCWYSTERSPDYDNNHGLTGGAFYNPPPWEEPAEDYSYWGGAPPPVRQ